MNAITLFSGAGIDEVYLSKIGIDVLIANELVEKEHVYTSGYTLIVK